MADASIIDIGGIQWNIKDKEARDKIASIEDILTVKVLPAPKFNKNPNYSYRTFQFMNHYSFGKIHFIYFRWQNISGSDIGSSESARIGIIDLLPAKETSFMMFDYISGRAMRCYLEETGYIVIGESNGVTSGNNVCFGELIFAEK